MLCGRWSDVKLFIKVDGLFLFGPSYDPAKILININIIVFIITALPPFLLFSPFPLFLILYGRSHPVFQYPRITHSLVALVVIARLFFP
jgi:hypothetical protein